MIKALFLSSEGEMCPKRLISTRRIKSCVTNYFVQKLNSDWLAKQFAVKKYKLFLLFHCEMFTSQTQN